MWPWLACWPFISNRMCRMCQEEVDGVFLRARDVASEQVTGAPGTKRCPIDVDVVEARYKSLLRQGGLSFHIKTTVACRT